MFKLLDLTKNIEYKKQVKALYKSAFPANERPPFGMLWRMAVKGNGEFFVAVQEDRFDGLAYTITRNNLVYLFFLAVKEDMRGNGIGGSIIEELKARYIGKNIVLNMEELDEGAKNYAERIRRKNFYFKHGFRFCSVKTVEAGVRYDMLLYGDSVTYEEYASLMKNFVGSFIYKLIFRQG